jgi:hypothetical protein
VGIRWGWLAFGILAGAAVGYWRSMSRPAHVGATNPIAGGSTLGGLSA